MLHSLNRRRKENFVSSINSIGVKGAALPAFDPVTYDAANLLGLWDGDLNTAGVAWLDLVASYPLTFGTTGVPTWSIVPGGLNGHDYIQFAQAGSGATGSYAQGVLPVRPQPTTQYLVFKNDSHLGNKFSCDDGVVTLRNAVRAIAPSPNIRYTSVAAGTSPLSNSPALGTFIVLTIVKQAGVLQSKEQINLNAPDVYTQPALLNDAGLTLNSNSLLGIFSFLDSAWAYIILRNGADSVADQNLYINYLMARFGL